MRRLAGLRAVAIGLLLTLPAPSGFAALESTDADRSNSPSDFGPAVIWPVGRDLSYAGLGSSVEREVNGTAGRPMLRSSAQLIGGTAGGHTTVGMEWRTRVILPDLFTREDAFLCSDILKLSGISLTADGKTLPGRNQTDLYVLQMGYDPEAVGNQYASFRLVWLNRGPGRLLGDSDDAWQYAVDGNFGPQTRAYFLKEFDPTTDFQLGYEGWDATRHLVWAVVNHDGHFAVVPRAANQLLVPLAISSGIVTTSLLSFASPPGTVPEPAALLTWALLGTIAVGFNWWRRRCAAVK